MVSETPRIFVIDSGVGGLSVCASLVARLPDCSLRFVADNAFHPYGEKSAEEVRARVFEIYNAYAPAFDPHLVVLACNTATIAAIYEARDSLHNPALLDFIGTEPAVKPATRRTLSGTIGLLATQATVDSAHVAGRIEEVGGDCNFLLRASPTLVQIAEEKMRGQRPSMEALAAELERCFNEDALAGMDTCILGCTHFPLLKPELKRLAPALNWIDTGEDVSRRACTLLGRTGLYLGASEAQDHWMTFTDPTQRVAIAPDQLVALGLPRLMVENVA